MTSIKQESGLTLNPQIEIALSFLEHIRPSYEGYTRNIRESCYANSMGCGPFAYTLAVLVQQVTEGLLIDATMSEEVDTNDGIHLIVGSVVIGGYLYDHGWLEIIGSYDALLVSPVASPDSPESSYHLVQCDLLGIKAQYADLGISRLNRRIIENLNYSQERWDGIQGILDDINAGTVPERYAPVYNHLSLIRHNNWVRPF